MRALIKMAGDWRWFRHSPATLPGWFPAAVATVYLVVSVIVSGTSLAGESNVDNKVGAILSRAHSLNAETNRVIDSRDDASLQELAAQWARLGYDARQLAVRALEDHEVAIRETPRRVANHAQDVADYLGEIASCNADGCAEAVERRLWGLVTLMSREFERKFGGAS